MLPFVHRKISVTLDQASFSDFSEYDCGILLCALNVHYIGKNNFIQIIWAMHLAVNYH
jgi:hypothetical protein